MRGRMLFCHFERHLLNEYEKDRIDELQQAFVTHAIMGVEWAIHDERDAIPMDVIEESYPFILWSRI